MSKILNTSCPSRCASAVGDEHRRLPVQQNLTGQHMRTMEDIVYHFCGLNFRCDACAGKHCPELILEITGLSNHLSQNDLNTLASMIHDIFELRYKRLQVFVFSDRNCGFYKTEQVIEAQMEQAA